MRLKMASRKSDLARIQLHRVGRYLQEKLNIEFHELKSQERHRGKYWLSFFYAWLDNLAFIRKCGTDGKVPTLVSLKFNSSKLSMRSLASRRLPPDSLQTFVQSAAR